MSLPATVVVRRTARPGCEQPLQDWSTGLCQHAQAQPGHVRSRVFREPVSDAGELLLGITFASPSALAAWSASSERAEHVEAVAALTEGEARPLSVDDLSPEEWIVRASLHAPNRRPPPRWVSALMVWTVLYPTVLFIGWLMGPILDSWHVLLSTFVTTALLVPFVLYLGVPLLQRALRPLLRKWG